MRVGHGEIIHKIFAALIGTAAALFGMVLQCHKIIYHRNVRNLRYSACNFNALIESAAQAAPPMHRHGQKQLHSRERHLSASGCKPGLFLRNQLSRHKGTGIAGKRRTVGELGATYNVSVRACMLVEKPCCCETRTRYTVRNDSAHWRRVAVIAGAWQLYKTVRTYMAFAGDKTPTAHTA